MSRENVEIERAIEVFVEGFCVGKSQTHPYEHQRIGRLWVMRDAPRRNPRNYRKEEWVSYGIEPREVDRVARQNTRGRFFVCAFYDVDESDESLRAEYKSLGYRLLAAEGLFVHRLNRIPRFAAPVKICQVKTKQLVEQFGKATRSRPIALEHLSENAPFRQYVAIEDGQLVGWVRSVYAKTSTWCSNMYVLDSHRRRGIGKAMLAKMLRDDRKLGVHSSVLLASRAGALLYPHVGYEQIGTLLLFAPKKP
jgi:GNAT superfamily N-acetyltransferase